MAMLGIFKLLKSLMVCDDPKSIALVFIALRVRQLSLAYAATFLAASDNR